MSATDSSLMQHGMDYLLDHGLIAEAGKDDAGNRFYGITEDGLKSVYLISLIMASGVTAQEIKGTDQEADARQVAQSATALVRALDEIGMDFPDDHDEVSADGQ